MSLGVCAPGDSAVVAGATEERTAKLKNAVRFFFNNGPLTPAAARAAWLKRSTELELPIVAESARWGDYRRDVYQYSNGPYEFYTRNNQWYTERNRLLNEYFPIVAEIVFRHEGTLEKYIGDALLAVWGVPFVHDDDADRAVAAAVEMQRAVRGRRFRIHVGLHTGLVAAGNVGTRDYVQYATVGESTNLASRICSVAGQGEIVISSAHL